MLLAFSLACLVMLPFFGNSAGAEPVPKHATGVRSIGECGVDGLSVLVNSTAAVMVESVEAKTWVALGAAESVAGSVVVTTAHGDEFILPPSRELRQCSVLPGLLPVLFAEAVTVFGRLDEVDRLCEGAERNVSRCVSVVFDIIDVTDDGRFSKAEISRAIRAAGFFIGYQRLSSERSDPFVPLEDMVIVQLATSALGPFVADNLIGSYDYDGDGFVSPAELLQDRNPEKGFERILAGLSTQMAPEALATLLKAVSGIGGMLDILQ